MVRYKRGGGGERTREGSGDIPGIITPCVATRNAAALT